MRRAAYSQHAANSGPKSNPLTKRNPSLHTMKDQLCVQYRGFDFPGPLDFSISGGEMCQRKVPARGFHHARARLCGLIGRRLKRVRLLRCVSRWPKAVDQWWNHSTKATRSGHWNQVGWVGMGRDGSVLWVTDSLSNACFDPPNKQFEPDSAINNAFVASLDFRITSLCCTLLWKVNGCRSSHSVIGQGNLAEHSSKGRGVMVWPGLALIHIPHVRIYHGTSFDVPHLAVLWEFWIVLAGLRFESHSAPGILTTPWVRPSIIFGITLTFATWPPAHPSNLRSWDPASWRCSSWTWPLPTRLGSLGMSWQIWTWIRHG